MIVAPTATTTAMSPTIGIPRGNFTSTINATLAQPPVAIAAVGFFSLVSSLYLGDNDQILRAAMTALTAASCIPTLFDAYKNYFAQQKATKQAATARRQLLQALEQEQQPTKQPSNVAAKQLLLHSYAAKIDTTAVEMTKLYCTLCTKRHTAQTALVTAKPKHKKRLQQEVARLVQEEQGAAVIVQRYLREAQ